MKVLYNSNTTLKNFKAHTYSKLTRGAPFLPRGGRGGGPKGDKESRAIMQSKNHTLKSQGHQMAIMQGENHTLKSQDHQMADFGAEINSKC